MNFPTCSDLALPEHWTIFLYFPTCWDCPCQHYPNSGKILCTFLPVWIFPVRITQTMTTSVNFPTSSEFAMSELPKPWKVKTSLYFPTSSEFAMSALPKPWKLLFTFPPLRIFPCHHYSKPWKLSCTFPPLRNFPCQHYLNPGNFLVLSHLLGILPVRISCARETFLYFPTS